MGMAIDEINGKLWRKIYVKLQKKQLNIMYWTQQKKTIFFSKLQKGKIGWKTFQWAYNFVRSNTSSILIKVSQRKKLLNEKFFLLFATFQESSCSE